MIQSNFHKYCLVLLFAVIVTGLSAQDAQIDSVINQYVRIDSIFCLNSGDPDTVKVSSIPDSLNEGSIALVYHSKGAYIDTTGIGDINESVNDKTGIYAIFRVDRIIQGSNYVIFTYSFPFTEDNFWIYKGPYMPGESAQLITVPRYKDATVTGKLTAAPWDPVTGTGGVCAMWVDRTLTLNANIDLTGLGFKGADPKIREYTGDSSVVDPLLYSYLYYDSTRLDRAGIKGEGLIRDDFTLLRGKGRNLNGGGGGNGIYAGGGGGGNGKPGGRGGDEYYQAPAGTGGNGGMGLKGRFYNNTDPYYRDRFFFGGGGGSGTQNPLAGFKASKGGNGGGIVLILAGTINGNNHSIIVDGESVTEVATGGAGGGGGGGVIMIHANNIDSTKPLHLSAKGGDGGDTYSTGPGGGGGGGIYWLFDSITDDLSIIPNYMQGNAGMSSEGQLNALKGGRADTVKGLDIQVRGFLFNSISGDRTICSDVIPPTIIGSIPKGGDPPFFFRWQKKIKDGPWLDMGDDTLISLKFDAPLSDTTSFRRIVKTDPSWLIPDDTSFMTTYNVHQALTGNTIIADDKICEGTSTDLLDSHPDSVLQKGGYPGTYTFKWEKMDTLSWSDATGTGFISDPTHQESLKDTTYFRRIVKSGACLDTSNTITIEVLKQLDNNLILSDDTIKCFGDVPDGITGLHPTGGDQDSIYYLWQQDSGPSGSFITFPYADSINQNISLPALFETTFFRRIVTSGTNKEGQIVCSDTSKNVIVTVLDTIRNNKITSPDQVVCFGLNADPIIAADVSGGNYSSYSFRWELSFDQIDWKEVGEIDSPHNPGIMDSTSTWFRRIVGSGGNQNMVCMDTSNILQVRVIGPLKNNIDITPADTSVKCQFDLEPVIEGEFDENGTFIQGDTINIHWQKSLGDTEAGDWTNVSILPDYTMESEISSADDLWFRRLVSIYSGTDSVCTNISDTVKIKVQAYPNWNIIDLDPEVCVNTKLDLDGEPDQGEPEPATFVWKQFMPFDSIIGSSPSSDLVTTPLLDKEDYVFARLVYKGVCEDTSNMETVYINPRPVAQILNSPVDETCEYDSTQLTPNPDNRYYIRFSFDPEEGTAPFTVTLSENETPLTGEVLQSYTDSMLVDPLTDDFSNYLYDFVSVVDANGCEAYPANIIGEVDLKVFATPEVQILTDNQLCPPLPSPDDPNPTIQLMAESDNGTRLIWRQVSGPYKLDILDSMEETASALIPNLNENAVYEFVFRSSKGTIKVCEGIDQKAITIFEEPVKDPDGGVFAGRDTTQYWINSVALNGSTNAGTGVWSTLTEGIEIADPASGSTYASNLILVKDGDNEFVWTVTNGVCQVISDTVMITREEVMRYEGFSPNGDGYNDVFIMKGLVDGEGDYPTRIMFTLNIYNSVGNLVRKVTQDDEFEMQVEPVGDPLGTDERIVWDGLSNNGSLVPPGIYYYGLEYYSDYVNEDKRVTGSPKRGSIVVKGY